MLAADATLTTGKPLLQPIWIVAFTGYRPKVGVAGRNPQELAACREPIREALSELRGLLRGDGSLEVMCSVAEGADHAAIRAAEDLGLVVHLILPLPVESFRDDFDTEHDPAAHDAWRETERWIEKASDPRSDWTIRIAKGDATRPGCYHEANLQMLETADVLLAVCCEDGLDARGKDDSSSGPVGGAEEMIEMAGSERFGVPTIVLDPSRGGATVRRDEPRFEANALDSVRADMHSDEARPPAGKNLGDGQRGGEDEIWAVHQRLDYVANRSSERFRRSFTGSILLHFGATVLAAISAAFAKLMSGSLFPSAILTLVELGFVTAATVVVWRAKRSQINPRWRRSRFGAELADSQIHSAGLIDPLRPVVLRHAERWKRFAISLSLAAHRQKMRRLAEYGAEERFRILRQEYLEHRIGRQIRYLKQQHGIASRRFDRWGTVGIWASLSAIVVISVAFVVKVACPVASKNALTLLVTLFLPIFLPVVASLASSMIIASDAARRASRYRQVRERLDRFQRLIPVVGTSSGMERVVLEIEDILLDEIIEWNATAENMEHMH